MKHFLLRILLFSTPIFIYVLVALFIDPYSIIHKQSNPKYSELNKHISIQINNPLFKLEEYSDNPTDLIILGDSRTNKLDTKLFDNLAKMNSSNLAYSGGTLSEIIKTFWYAAEIHNLKEVYIGINFNLYNETQNMNRVDEAIKLKNSPVLYLFSKYCLKSIYLVIKSSITNEIINIEEPNLNKAEFWEYQLESSANNFYRVYQYPVDYHQSLLEISKYCKRKNIKLIFFIPPTHIDLQQKVNEFDLETMESRFIADLLELGQFYNFDYPNKITENKDNFLDPFHYNDSIANLVVHEIVTGNINHARTYNNVDYKGKSSP